MKQFYLIIALVIASLSSCSEEKKNKQEEAKRIFQIESVDEKSGLQRMQISRVNQEIICKGKKFQLSVERTPDEKLPHVKSDMGLFVDNIIKVRITQSNGTSLFEKTFTKNDFASYLPEKYLKRSVLEGLVFDDVRTAEKKEITLAARALDSNIYSAFTDGTHRVSFDKVVEVMKQTGHDLPSLYKETSTGGLAKDYIQME